MEVLQYHIFGQILWGYPLVQRPSIGLIYGRELQFRFLRWALMLCCFEGYRTYLSVSLNNLIEHCKFQMVLISN